MLWGQEEKISKLRAHLPLQGSGGMGEGSRSRHKGRGWLIGDDLSAWHKHLGIS
jgi:hypothetical protein